MIYKESLEKLGYALKDHGNHWRTSAVYRNGKTSTSVIIYKNTGVWRDFGIDSTPMPFKVLVEKTLNTKDPNILKQYISDKGSRYYKPLQYPTIPPTSKDIYIITTAGERLD